jgi:hypothetical protein
MKELSNFACGHFISALLSIPIVSERFSGRARLQMHGICLRRPSGCFAMGEEELVGKAVEANCLHNCRSLPQLHGFIGISVMWWPELVQTWDEEGGFFDSLEALQWVNS